MMHIKIVYLSFIKARQSTLYEYMEKCGKGKGEFHPRTGPEGPEGE
jgi:hypothetical protein